MDDSLGKPVKPLRAPLDLNTAHRHDARRRRAMKQLIDSCSLARQRWLAQATTCWCSAAGRV